MLPPAMEGKIEDTVDLTLEFPSVSERYWTKYYFIPKDRRKPMDEEEAGERGGETGGGLEVMEAEEGLGKKEEGEKGGGVKEEGSPEKRDKQHSEKENKHIYKKIKSMPSTDAQKNGNKTQKMDIDYTTSATEKNDKTIQSNNKNSHESKQEEAGGGGTSGQNRRDTDSSGHVCVMVHTNKLCLVTLSPKHPALAPGMEITKVSYNVGKFNRLENQVSGKGKRGAQMMGPQSPVCVITCADGSQYSILAGVHGKLVEVNERLLTNPKLLSDRPDAEGYLAVILPPLRNGDAPLKRLLTSDQYWAQER